MTEWPFVEYKTLSSSHRSAFSMGPFGSKITKENYVTTGVPVIRGVNLSKGVFVDDDFVFIEPQKADELISANVASGDLIFTHRGTIGQVSMVPRKPRFDRYIIGSSQVKTRLDESLAVPEFYYYWFRSLEGQRSILANASTVGVPGIATPLTSIKSMRVPLPPLSTQRAIAGMLGVLDEKIAVNDRIAATADALRSALLEDARTEPESFVTRPLSQLAEFINGRAFTKDATGHGRMVIRISEINSGPGPSTVYNDIAVDDKHLARPGDVLFSWSGSLTVARWHRPEAIVNQHIFKVVPKSDIPKWLIFEVVKSKLTHYQAIAADKATTMGHIQRRHLDEEVLVPDAETIARLHFSASSLWHRALEAEQESLTLIALRDTLLPELLSNRLRVRDAEKAVEEAV